MWSLNNTDDSGWSPGVGLEWPNMEQEIYGIKFSVYLVMALGIFAGSISKAITGFGSMIVHLCIWSIMRATTNLDTGTLHQAIVTEVVFRTVTAYPYIVMTRAFKTANFKLVCSIALFQTLGSPFGSWLMVRINVQQLELVMACCLLLVLIAQVAAAWLWPHPPDRTHPASSTTTAAVAAAPAGPVQHAVQPEAWGSTRLDGRSGRSDSTVTDSSTGSTHGDPVTLKNKIQVWVVEPSYDLSEPLLKRVRSEEGVAVQQYRHFRSRAAAGDRPQRKSDMPRRESEVSEGSSGSTSDMQAVVVNAAGAGQQGWVRGGGHTASILQDPGEHHTKAAIMIVGGSQSAAPTLIGSSPSDDSIPLIPSTDDSQAELGKAAGSMLAASEAAARQQQQQLDRRREWLVLVGAGSLAGTLSGVMGGLTGIDGPPTIFMFEALGATKEVVRGTNAIANVALMVVLLISYSIHGVFLVADIPLYALASVVGMVGTYLGDVVTGWMNPAAFHAMLQAMVVLCAGLMAGSGLGWLGGQPGES